MTGSRHWIARAAVFILTAVVAEGVLSGSTLPARLDFTPLSESQIDRLLARGTVELLSLGCDLSLGQGTGVAVATDRVLTSRHVVAGFRSLNLITDDRPARMVAPADVSFSAGVDVAVIRAAGLPDQPFSVAAYDPKTNEHVWVAGFPRGPSGRTGLVVLPSSVIGYAGGPPLGQSTAVLRVRGDVQPGMSGGPVLDQAGRLAGVVFGVDNATHDTLAIPASALRRPPQAPPSHPHC